MIGQPAKVLRPGDVRRALAWASRRRHGLRNRAMILLSVRAGLRAAEIAGLTWTMVLNASGQVGNVLELPAANAKWGSGRRLPLHPELRCSLLALSRGDQA